MKRPAPLNRLREISKQRSIRRPLLMPVPDNASYEERDGPPTKVEWPVKG
jgi:hypothetical protein